jgi:uncharacterized protein YgiB involved in biofilm formation
MGDVLPPRRRKRSASARLSAAGLAAMLSACDGTPDPQQQFGEPTEVAAFQSVNECVASGAFSQVQCTEASNDALANDARAAPRYESQSVCEDAFGDGQCLRRTDGGQSFFVPLLTGFMIGRLLDGGGYRYHGLYRSRRDDSYYTGSGAWLHSGGYGGRSWRYQVGSRAVAAPPAPVTTQRIQTRSSVVSRGGFGGRAGARGGGWGGFGG